MYHRVHKNDCIPLGSGSAHLRQESDGMFSLLEHVLGFRGLGFRALGLQG